MSQLETHKAIESMAVPIPTLPEVTAVELREQARRYYGVMQTSWFLFAKTVEQIRNSNAYRDYGHKSFAAFCAEEYPAIHLATMSKLLRVVDMYGKEIQARLERNPTYQLPAWESCYTLYRVKKALPKPDFSIFKKEVLEGKISLGSLRGKLKEIISNKRSEGVKKSAEELEAELTEEIKEERFLSDEDEVTEDFDEVVDGDGENKVRALVMAMHNKIIFLQEAVPKLSALVTNDSSLLTEQVIEMGEELDSLNTKINEFLNKLEEMTQ